MSFDMFLLAVESRDLSEADMSMIRVYTVDVYRYSVGTL